MGYEIHDPDGFVTKTRDTMGKAVDLLHDAIDKLGDATMPENTLGVLGELSKAGGDDLTKRYNDARDTAVDKLWSDIKAIVDSVRSVEETIHEYNGAEKSTMDKLIFAGENPLKGYSQPVGPTQQHQTGGGKTQPHEKPSHGAQR